MSPLPSRITRRISARGQVTLGKQVLLHLGMKPGDAVELELLPGGRAPLVASRPRGSIDAFIGMFAGRSDRVLSAGEIRRLTAVGWAGKR